MIPWATLTYVEFHALFVLPALAGLSAVTARRHGGWGRSHWLGAVLMAVVALAYTTPWDNYLIARGVWRYGRGRVAMTVWHAPVSEYVFIALQPLLTALWLAQLRARTQSVTVTPRQRAVGVAGGGVVAAVGVALVLAPSPGTYYLGAILAWAGPVLALQWGFGWPYLWATRRTVAIGVGLPTAYFWIADRAALSADVWILSDRFTTGLALAGLPVEEAVFFLVTNLFVVQGLVLLRWVVERPTVLGDLTRSVRQWGVSR